VTEPAKVYDFTGNVIAVDFDGVLHSYVSGWTGHLPRDPAERGALEFIQWLAACGAEIVVMSARAGAEGGKEAIRDWLREQGFPELTVTDHKVIAAAYVDDRAVPYAAGNWADCQARIARLVRPAPNDPDRAGAPDASLAKSCV
jgi:hypothetical protein